VTARRRLDLATLRRLQLVAQRLAGPPATGIMDVARSLRRIQLDPTSAVARSHELVLWSRLGPWDRDELTRLLEVERSLFEIDAFIVPTEDWPMYAAAMAAFPIHATKRARDTVAWIADNDRLRRSILDTLERDGARATSDFEDVATRSWKTSGWNDARNVSRMLEFLALRGEVIRAGRRGTERRWDLPARWLPEAPPALPFGEALKRAVELRVHSRGASAMPLPSPYSAAPPPFAGLPTADVIAACGELASEGAIVPVDVDGMRGDWFVHREHLATLDAVRDDLPQPRTTLLSPFDAIVSNRDQLERVWGMRYRLEMYVPAARREYGYFVLPILHGDQFIARVDPKLDRTRGVLVVHSVHAQEDAPLHAAIGAAIGGALIDLASFAGAAGVEVRGDLPAGWARGLRRHRSITFVATAD
jgi:uncharacterized protein YcaQ